MKSTGCRAKCESSLAQRSVSVLRGQSRGLDVGALLMERWRSQALPNGVPLPGASSPIFSPFFEIELKGPMPWGGADHSECGVSPA